MAKKTIAVTVGMDSAERASELGSLLTQTVGLQVSTSLAMHAAIVYAQKHKDDFAEWYTHQYAMQPKWGGSRKRLEIEE